METKYESREIRDTDQIVCALGNVRGAKVNFWEHPNLTTIRLLKDVNTAINYLYFLACGDTLFVFFRDFIVIAGHRGIAHAFQNIRYLYFVICIFIHTRTDL